MPDEQREALAENYALESIYWLVRATSHRPTECDDSVSTAVLCDGCDEPLPSIAYRHACGFFKE